MLRILIADDHEIVRRGVRQIVEAHPGWEVCGEAADGQAALSMAIQEKPDVLVLDVSLPVMNGIAVTRRLRQDAPHIKVLLFTMHDDDETVSAGLSAGARGYLLKMENEQLLEAAVHDRRKSRLESFTNRELEVAQLISEGNSNKHIARLLSLSVKTVESHRAAAMRKAGVHTTAEFVRFAIKQKLIQP
jgi:DNA-binding NarL/FixJ family response regulator